MIDIHSHVIPGTDDGAKNIEEAEKMLQIAVQNDIRCIVATPHSGSFLYDIKSSRKKYEELQKLIMDKRIPIKVMLGSEILCEPKNIEDVLDNLNNKKLPSINGTRYILIEMLCSNFEEVLICVESLMERHWIPIFAHPERYCYISIEKIGELRKIGCYMQLNLNNVIEDSGIIKDRSLKLLEKQCIDFVGTDSHSASKRSPVALEAIDFLKKNYSKDYVENILFKNAMKMLRGQNE